MLSDNTLVTDDDKRQTVRQTTDNALYTRLDLNQLACKAGCI